MAFTLRVRFKGHCAFAPKHDGSEARVFLLNESEVDQERPNLGLVPHYAGLSVRAVHLSATGAGAPGDLFWFLRQQRIRIIPPTAVPPDLRIEGFSDLGTPREPSLVRRPRSNDRGFWWLAPIERACTARQLQAGGGNLDRDFLRDRLDETVAKLLAARVEFDTGTLKVDEFLKNGDDFIVWRFLNFDNRRESRDHFQILAGIMLLEQTINGDYVTIEAASLVNPDDPDEKRELRLYPRDGRVDVTILNEEADEFMPRQVATPVVLRTPRFRDRIFEAFYKLSRNPPPPDELPMPIADYLISEQTGRPPAQSAPPCSPSRFEAYT
jgi:hypothetical protein